MGDAVNSTKYTMPAFLKGGACCVVKGDEKWSANMSLHIWKHRTKAQRSIRAHSDHMTLQCPDFYPRGVGRRDEGRKASRLPQLQPVRPPNCKDVSRLCPQDTCPDMLEGAVHRLRALSLYQTRILLLRMSNADRQDRLQSYGQLQTDKILYSVWAPRTETCNE
jgi:hypothetical protein